jgi:uncharacterized membrane protein
LLVTDGFLCVALSLMGNGVAYFESKHLKVEIRCMHIAWNLKTFFVFLRGGVTAALLLNMNKRSSL